MVNKNRKNDPCHKLLEKLKSYFILVRMSIFKKFGEEKFWF